ncbi:uncharacterized protein LAESUDRAFT_732960, partial [Laetiporus sulphureus 93-53]
PIGTCDVATQRSRTSLNTSIVRVQPGWTCNNRFPRKRSRSPTAHRQRSRPPNEVHRRQDSEFARGARYSSSNV